MCPSHTPPTPAMQRLLMLMDHGTCRILFAHTTENAVLAAYGMVHGQPVYAFSQEPVRAAAAFSAAQITAIERLYQMAAETGAPIVGIYDFDGDIPLPEKASAAYNRLFSRAADTAGVVPRISVISGGCYGSDALLACCADLTMMTEKAVISLMPAHAFSGEQTAQAGMISCLCKNDETALQRTRLCLRMLPAHHLAPAMLCDYVAPAYHMGATLTSAVQSVADRGSLVQLGKQWLPDVYTAFSTLEGHTTAIAGIRTQALNLAGCRKLMKLFQICNDFSIPVILFLEQAAFSAETPDALYGAAALTHCWEEMSVCKISVLLRQADETFLSAAGGADFRIVCAGAEQNIPSECIDLLTEPEQLRSCLASILPLLRSKYVPVSPEKRRFSL